MSWSLDMCEPDCYRCSTIMCAHWKTHSVFVWIKSTDSCWNYHPDAVTPHVLGSWSLVHINSMTPTNDIPSPTNKCLSRVCLEVQPAPSHNFDATESGSPERTVNDPQCGVSCLPAAVVCEAFRDSTECISRDFHYDTGKSENYYSIYS